MPLFCSLNYGLITYNLIIMKKNLLVVSFLLSAANLFAQNVLVNGDFEAAGTTIEEVTATTQAPAGTWASFLKSGKTGFTIETQEKENHGTVAVLNTLSAAPGWYEHFLMQNIALAPRAEVYRLSFDIKSTSDTKSKLTTQIYCGNNNYVFKNNFDLQGGKSAASAATYEVQATDAWQHVELFYDFSQMCNNINSPKSVNKVGTADEDLTLFKVEPTTEALLSQCRLTINAYKAKPNVLLIDNIRLESVTPSVNTENGSMTLYGIWTSADMAGLDLSSPLLTNIDLSGILIPADAPSLAVANPNALIYTEASASVPASWTNVVKGNTAETITLTDNDRNGTYHPFNNTKEFTATAISYKRHYPTEGWSSICLPFAVSTLPDGIAAEKFTGSEGTKVNFREAQSMDANTPYIMKVTGVGEKEFKADGVTIGATSAADLHVNPDNGNYALKGTLDRKEEATGLFVLDPNGTGFSKATADNFIPAFRAYMEGTSTSDTKRLTLGQGGGGTTGMEITATGSGISMHAAGGILTICSGKIQTVQLWSVDGRLIRTIQLTEGNNRITDLPKGIYLVNRQKIAVK